MINWLAVANELESEANRLERDTTAFPNDFVTQKEMRTRASIFMVFSRAIRVGVLGEKAR